jgi:c(7)-type cytochrome triheme protein
LLALLGACADKSRKEVLAYFFDDVDEPAPATRRVRRNLEREIQQLQRDLAQAQRALDAAKAAAARPKGQRGGRPAEEAKTWPEAEELLPKHETGQVDWVQALAGGTIAPGWGLDAEAPQKPVLDMDVDLTPASGGAFGVVFPHRAHTEWLDCDNCHPAVFEASKGANSMSMARIKAGEGCGACHGTNRPAPGRMPESCCR